MMMVGGVSVVCGGPGRVRGAPGERGQQLPVRLLPCVQGGVGLPSAAAVP